MSGVDLVSYLIHKDKSKIGTINEGVYTRYYSEILLEKNYK